MTERPWSFTDEEIEEIQRQFHASYDQLDEPLMLSTPSHRIIACTKFFVEPHGYSEEELVGQSVGILDRGGSGQERDAHAETTFPALKRNVRESGLGIHYRKNGEAFRIEWTTRVVELLGHELVLHMNRESAAEVPQTLFQENFQYRRDPVVLVDPHQEEMPIVECNPAYAKLLGYSMQELVGSPVGDFSTSQDEEAYRHWLNNQRANVTEDIKSSENFHFDGARVHKNGTVIPVKTHWAVVQMYGRELLLVTLYDVFEEQQQRLRSRVYDLITHAAPLSETLQYLGAMIENQIQGTRCAILLNEDSGLAPVVTSTLPDVFEQHFNSKTTQDMSTHMGPLSEPLCGHPLYLEDLEDIDVRQRWQQHPLVTTIEGARALWIFPLQGSESVSALVAIYHEAPQSPTEEDLKHIKPILQLGGIAIESKRQTEKLAHQAEHDYLTGLPNRLLFEDRLGQALSLAQRRQSNISLLLLDLDGFKHVNDTLGHAAGDILLKEMAQRLQGAVRRSDTVGRLGGDEFVVLLGDVKDPEDTVKVAEKVLHAIKEPFDIFNSDIFVTTSIGIAVYPQHGTDSVTLMRNADAALYRAKGAGKNKYEYFEENLGHEVQERLQLKAQLRRAFAEKQFEVFYQPQFEVSDQRCIGFEALLRWKHPEFGLMLPLTFIPAAEESGIILKIGEWVLEQVCAQLHSWHEQGLKDIRVAINISALQFLRGEFFKTLGEVIKQYHLEPQALELELSESVVMQNVEETARQIARLHDLGVRLSVDDYGAGYSSLSYLKKLPLSGLKIDQSFVRDVHLNEQSKQLLNSMIMLAHSLNLRVTAEGVESAGELRVLKQLGCDIVQGHLLGKPTTSDKAQYFFNNFKKLPS